MLALLTHPSDGGLICNHIGAVLPDFHALFVPCWLKQGGPCGRPDCRVCSICTVSYCQ